MVINTFDRLFFIRFKEATGKELKISKWEKREVFRWKTGIVFECEKKTITLLKEVFDKHNISIINHAGLGVKDIDWRTLWLRIIIKEFGYENS